MINVSADRQLWRLLTPLIKDHSNKDKHKIFVTNSHFKSIRKFVFAKTENLPRYVKRRLIRHYVKIFNKKRANTRNSELFANIWLRDVVKPVEKILSNCPFKNPKALRRDEVVEQYAKKAADECVSMVAIVGEAMKSEEYEKTILFAYSELAVYCADWGILPPYKNQVEKHEMIEAAECAILRMSCEKWWLRKFMRIKNQTNEHILIAIGEVQKKVSPYISAQSLSEWNNQQKANRDYLEAMELVSINTCPDTGAEYENIVSLVDMADASSSNPKNRFTELMIRCRGLENLAIDDGYIGLFVTITAPSKYHASSEKWNGCTPKDAQAYLVKTWSKIRAELKRKNVIYYGVRVAEPHHDATPHWHMLLFVLPEQANALVYTMEDYAMQVDGCEKGADKHRFTVEVIDPNKGSATGYIAKYLSKNINGEYIENNKTEQDSASDFDSGKSASEGAKRATAWASRWCIRQFQFFGAEPVTIYREARRLALTAENDEIEKIRQAVETTEKSGKWYAFTKAMQASRVNLAYEESTNDYGERIKKIKGLISSTGYEETREGVYLLRKRGSVFPWSPVNNCTARASDSEASTLKPLGFNSQEMDYLSNGYRVSTGDGHVYQVKDNQLREYKGE
ncbi:replication endonuclease [Colwellia sp. E150_009]